MNRRTFLLSGLATLGGCGGVWNLPSYDDLPPDKSGLAIATVGGNWPLGRFAVGFRPVASPTTVGQFRFWRNFQTPIDIREEPVLATVATHRLPPGMYEIYAASVWVHLGVVQFTYYDKRPFTFPFEILPGKATYLGEFLGYPVKNESAETGVLYTVRNRRTRNLALLRKRGVEISDDAVIDAVMTKSESANSVFRRLDDAF